MTSALSVQNKPHSARVRGTHEPPVVMHQHTMPGQDLLQRKEGQCACGGGCPRCRQPLQAKLEVSQPGDALEQEADRVAEQVLRMPQPEPAGTLESRKGAGLRLSRYSSSAPAQQHPSVVPPVVQHSLSAPGQLLDAATRTFFEPRFGRDLSHVRVREDPAAADALHAEAFAVGHDVVFAAHRYAPGTQSGRRLLAHELAHVLQQADPPRVLRQLRPEPAVPEGYIDRLLIALDAGGVEILRGINTGLVAILIIFALTAAAAALLPELAAAVATVLTTLTIAGASLASWLAALGISYAASELFMAYMELDAVLRQPHPTRAQIEAAGRAWGERTGVAISLFIPVFMAAAGRLLYQAERALLGSLLEARSGVTAATEAVISEPVIAEASVPAAMVESAALEEISFAEISLELELSTGGGSGAGVRSAVADARAAGLIDEAGNPLGPIDAAVQPHGSAPTVRSELGLVAEEGESAHIAATSSVRGVEGYSRSRALTVLLRRITHRAFDRHWQEWAMSLRRGGRTDISVSELYREMLRAIEQIPDVSQRLRDVLAWLLERELFVELGLAPAARVTLPYPNIPPAAP